MINRVYISGPISNKDPEEQRKKFKRIQLAFKMHGVEAFNPMENGLEPDSTTHQHMHRDLATLTREENPFDTIYMMEGWTHSKGCKVEFDVATAIGMKVIFEEVLNIIDEMVPPNFPTPIKFK